MAAKSPCESRPPCCGRILGCSIRKRRVVEHHVIGGIGEFLHRLELDDGRLFRLGHDRIAKFLENDPAAADRRPVPGRWRSRLLSFRGEFRRSAWRYLRERWRSFAVGLGPRQRCSILAWPERAEPATTKMLPGVKSIAMYLDTVSLWLIWRRTIHTRPVTAAVFAAGSARVVEVA